MEYQVVAGAASVLAWFILIFMSKLWNAHKRSFFTLACLLLFIAFIIQEVILLGGQGFVVLSDYQDELVNRVGSLLRNGICVVLPPLAFCLREQES